MVRGRLSMLLVVLAVVVTCLRGNAAPGADPPASPVPGSRLPSPSGAPLVVDLHCDTLNQIRGIPGFSLGSGSSRGLPRRAQLNLPLLRAGGVNVQVFAAWVPSSLSGAAARGRVDLMVANLKRQAALNRSRMAVCYTPDDCRRAVAQGRLAAVASIEGGHALGRTRSEVLSAIDHFRAIGVRIISLTWTNDSAMASAAGHPGGLTAVGREAVSRMMDAGILVDISHASLRAARATVELARKRGLPVVATHSCVDAVFHHRRNLPDDLIRGIHRVQGVIGINFNSEFLGPGQATVEDLVRHIDHVRRLVGDTSCVALGSDFDGGIIPPAGLENAGRMQAVRRALARHGYSEADIQGIMGENFLRCWERMQQQ